MKQKYISELNINYPMKTRILYPVATLCTFCLLGCSNLSSSPQFPESPSRAAYEGFSWQDVSGSGLRFWAQSNGNIRIETDDYLITLRELVRRHAAGLSADMGYEARRIV